MKLSYDSNCNMIKSIISLGFGMLALLLFLYLCWGAGTDAQGAIGLFLFLPIIIGLFIASLVIFRAGKSRIIITILLFMIVPVAVFYISALGSRFYKPLGNIPAYVLNTVSQKFESVVGVSSYEWGHRGVRLIHVSARNGDIEKLKSLLKRGTPIDYVNYVGETPLFFCADHGQKKACQFLIINGANINHRRIDGATVLHIAVYSRDLDMVKLLVESGIDRSIRNNDHKTALDIAVSDGNPTKLQSTISDYLLSVANVYPVSAHSPP